MHERKGFERMNMFTLEGESPVVLYGAGKYGRAALANIRKHYPGADVRYFVDDNRIRNSGEVDGLEVISLETARERLGEDFYIVISNYYVPEILKRLEQARFDPARIVFAGELLIEDMPEEMAEKHREEMRQVFDALEDYPSKMIYRAMAEARRTKSIDLLGRTCGEEQYFPKEDWFMLGEEEVFVDAGAYDGDTVDAFLRNTGGRFSQIHAFEPDRENYRRLETKMGGQKGISIYHAGLYDRNGTLSFSGNKGGSSTVTDAGADDIEVRALDEMKGMDPVTFVKMDIEGSELKALEGMKRIIARDRPKLAVCIYHKFEDLWEIPLYIRKLVPEYRLYIRNYTTYLDEIVLYAVL